MTFGLEPSPRFLLDTQSRGERHSGEITPNNFCMDHYSILDQGASPAEPQTASPNLAITNAPLPAAKGPHEPLRFPGEDGGRSLSAMAQRDLDAALQLLAERAQYITGASGAAIALREGEEMICRASAGPSAPELGATLQVNSGLSGESVRTRKILRCDDSETDARVNRESCRMLGIASVVVMPLVRDQEVNGVFELLSGRAYAFEERDLAALERLGEMIQTAVEHAEAAKRAEKELAGGTKDGATEIAQEKMEMESAVEAEAVSAPATPEARSVAAAPKAKPEEAGLEKPEEASLQKAQEPRLPKPVPATSGDGALAETKSEEAGSQPGVAAQTQSTPETTLPEAKLPETIPHEAKLLATPQPDAAALNEHGNVGQCEACGFPVSAGRKVCLDCEAAQANSGAPQFLSEWSTSEQSWFRSHLYLIGTLLVAALTVAVLVWLR